MCGIVAATASNDVVPVLLEGLQRLEYRGYDSAGLAVVESAGRLFRHRTVGRVADLAVEVAGLTTRGAQTGIAHTRWATHGTPSERNAHPHVSGEVAVVHNGIIENYQELRQALEKEGFVFVSDTDTESIAHLVAFYLGQVSDLAEAVRLASRRLKGAFAIAVILAAEPGRIVVAREGSPLLLGLGDHGVYAASDVSALLQVTRRVVYLENGDIADLHVDGYTLFDQQGQSVERPVVVSQLSNSAMELGTYRHYMQKEIFEQPEALANTLELVLAASSLQPGLFGSDAAQLLESADSVLILACGTSHHAGLVARYWIESLAGVPVTVEIASEYRYRESIANARQLVVAISQSGETADTLAALQHAQELGQNMTLALCNAPESAIVRASALRFITRAGPEIGVASTKAFTTQLVALFLLALVLAKLKGRLSPEEETESLRAMANLPEAARKVLDLEPEIVQWAKGFAGKQHALFLGRGRHYPIALEGALKLKEISYIHAEGYPAGELKHGPLALVDKEMPVIAVAPNDNLLEKLRSNLQEVRARGGKLFVFAGPNTQFQETDDLHIMTLPEHYGQLSPVMNVLPLQLLAYHVALIKGTDVDKPRNLAKSVTVE